MTFLRSWLLSVTACAVLISIAQQLANDGAMKKIVRFVGGMVLMLAMLRPLLSLSFDLPALDGESYREAVEANPDEKAPSIEGKTCLCYQMRNYKLWTCGATTSRLKETSVRLPDGTWYEPPAEHIVNDYLYSKNDEIRLPEVPASVESAALQALRESGSLAAS